VTPVAGKSRDKKIEDEATLKLVEMIQEDGRF
jgi:hypothetical protein